jgi:hypothetical protein
MTKKTDLESEIVLADRGPHQTPRMWYFFAADGDRAGQSRAAGAASGLA